LQPFCISLATISSNVGDAGAKPMVGFGNPVFDPAE
jgi:hypothetical protein